MKQIGVVCCVRFHKIGQEISKKHLEKIKFKNMQKDKDRIAIVDGGTEGKNDSEF